VVLLILGILLAIAVPSYNAVRNNASDSARVTQMEVNARAIVSYAFLDNGIPGLGHVDAVTSDLGADNVVTDPLGLPPVPPLSNSDLYAFVHDDVLVLVSGAEHRGPDFVVVGLVFGSSVAAFISSFSEIDGNWSALIEDKLFGVVAGSGEEEEEGEDPVPPGGEMVLLFDTNLAPGTEVALFFPDDASVDLVVNWGDTTVESVSEGGIISHEYAVNGQYQVSLTGTLSAYGSWDAWEYPSGALIEVVSWDDGLGIVSLEAAFYEAYNLVSVPANLPSTVESLSFAFVFDSPSLFNQSLNSWDVSNVSDMSGMFFGTSSFNQDLDLWDTGSVTDMNSMFWGASAFDGDISSWNVSSVQNMGHMFANASTFNGDISSWQTGGVTNMGSMFSGASSFSQDLDLWNVSNVESMQNMFAFSSFNGDISSWSPSSVSNMSRMFQYNTVFNQSLNSWDVSNLDRTDHMFWGASAFDGDISSWDVSAVSDARGMFQDASAFNGDLSLWTTSSLEVMHNMFNGATLFNSDLNSFDVSGVTNLTSVFREASAFDGDISSWDVSNVTSMATMFTNASSFNGDISSWQTGNVIDMGWLLYGATVFNQDLSSWDVSSVSVNTSYDALAPAWNPAFKPF